MTISTPTETVDATRPLHGRVAVITGASGGIGAATARHLTDAGAAIGLLARREPELRALADELRTAGASAEVAVIDVTAPTP